MQFKKAIRLTYVVTATVLTIPTTGRGDVAGAIMVFTGDSSSATAPPPATTATLNGAESQTYGTTNLVTFSGYFEEGIHTVEVATAASGYLPRQSPTDPHALADPLSDYGNPRYVAISNGASFVAAGFQYDPVVTASASVRDGWTMERLEDVNIEFLFQDTTNQFTVTKYPETATYASNWVSGTTGEFPPDTILYLDDYDLRLTKSGYYEHYSSNVIVGASPGDHHDLGTLFLYPSDANTNGIGDAWETMYYGAGCDAMADTDNDGLCNRDEYLAGTDPTNWYSCLWLFQTVQTNGNILYQWETASGRTYRICGTTNLCSDTWVQVAGSWEATNGQYSMEWAETNTHLSWCNSYRLDIMPCGWTGTNSILINTNRPVYEGTGSTNWWPGLPPLP